MRGSGVPPGYGQMTTAGGIVSRILQNVSQTGTTIRLQCPRGQGPVRLWRTTIVGGIVSLIREKFSPTVTTIRLQSAREQGPARLWPDDYCGRNRVAYSGESLGATLRLQCPRGRGPVRRWRTSIMGGIVSRSYPG